MEPKQVTSGQDKFQTLNCLWQAPKHSAPAAPIIAWLIRSQAFKQTTAAKAVITVIPFPLNKRWDCYGGVGADSKIGANHENQRKSH